MSSTEDRPVKTYTGGKPNYVTEPEITHAFGCWSWGPGHYLCALEHIKNMPKQLPKQYSYYEYIKENSYSYIKRDMNGVVTTVWAFDTGDGTDMYDMEKALEAATKSK